MSTAWHDSVKRSTSAATQAAPGKIVPHCLNARLVVMIVGRSSWRRLRIPDAAVDLSTHRGDDPAAVQGALPRRSSWSAPAHARVLAAEARATGARAR